MASYKYDAAKLDKVIRKTIEAIENSKKEIYDIAESARKECKKLEEELHLLKIQVAELIDSVEVLEAELKESKKRLLQVNKNFEKHSQEELKSAYEKADNLRIELAVKREKEQYFIRRRNDLEVRLKDSMKTIERSENLMANISVALGYLTGDLKELSLQLEDMQQRQLLGLRIIEAQEEERQRVAREIHDGPAQSMSNVVLKAELCERLLESDESKARDELRQLKKIVRDSLMDVRKIIYNLRPMSLDDLGLVPTLERHIVSFQEDSGISISFKTRGIYVDIRPAVSLTVFRIVQEAVNNIIKHSEAQNAVVNLEFTHSDIKLYIYDDGKGFDAAGLKRKGENMEGGFGLLSMRERVELLNGSFHITSQPNNGTRLNISIPLNYEEDSNDEQNQGADS